MQRAAQPPTAATVADYMTTDVGTVEPHTDISFVAGVFPGNGFRRLPVAENVKIVGAGILTPGA